MFSSKKIIFANNNPSFSVMFVDQFTGDPIDDVFVAVREKRDGDGEGVYSKSVTTSRFGNVFVLNISPQSNCFLSISSNSYHNRDTYLKMPESSRDFQGRPSGQQAPYSGLSVGNPFKIPLVPSSFNMSSFNSMVRGQPYSGYLQRRTNKFTVGIFSNYLQFISNDTYIIQASQIKGQISESFLKSKRDYIADSLSQITPWNYSDGNGVSNSSVYEGRNVHLNDTVLVGYYQGLRSMIGFIGYGSWKVGSSGRVVSGHAMVDTSAGDTTLLHEIGHAMGYNHVVGVTSMMNSTSTNTMSDFDVGAGKIVFTRSLRNIAPYDGKYGQWDRDNLDSFIGYHYPNYFDYFGPSDIALSDVEEKEEEFIVNIGCWEDGSSSLDVYRTLENGSIIRIDGHERR